MATTSQRNDSADEKLSLALLNINSLRNNIPDIQHIIARDKLHVVALCETKLDDSIKDSRVYIPGFRMWRRDRTNNRTKNGGGVALYVQDHIETRLRPDLMKNEANKKNFEVEIIWVEMKLPEGRPVLLGCCYRGPRANAEYLDQIHVAMTQVSGENKDIFLMGDFNIDWFSDSEKKKTTDLISRLDWTQIVKDATRVTVDSKKCIDHIYTNIPHHSKSKSIPTGCSDHNLITVKVNRNIPQSNGNFRSNKFDKRETEKCLSGKFSRENHSEKTLDQFTKVFLSVADEHAPLVNQDIYDSLRLDDELEALIIGRDKAKKEVIEKINTFIEKKKAVQDWINEKQKTKTQQQRKGAEVGTGEEIWPSNEMNITQDADSDYLEDSNPTSTGTTDSESDSDGSLVQPRKKRRDEFSFRMTDAETVKRRLLYLCDHVICEIDQTEAELMKLAADFISAPIGHILNRCIETGEIPDELKKIKLFPFSPNNYIHIRRSSGADRIHIMVGYIFDINLYEEAEKVLNDKKLISSAFDEIEQVETAWLKASEANQTVGAVFLDFSSAFNTISHDHLINKLRTSGFTDSALKLIKSFLSYHEGSSGLPRGSFLAELLFIVFISDIKANLTKPAVICNSYMMIYASDDQQRLDDEMTIMHKWAKQFNISFYKTKHKQVKSHEMRHILKTFKYLLCCHEIQLNWIRPPGNIMWYYDCCKYNISKELELYFGPTSKARPSNVKGSVNNSVQVLQSPEAQQ